MSNNVNDNVDNQNPNCCWMLFCNFAHKDFASTHRFPKQEFWSFIDVAFTVIVISALQWIMNECDISTKEHYHHESSYFSDLGRSPPALSPCKMRGPKKKKEKRKTVLSSKAASANQNEKTGQATCNTRFQSPQNSISEYNDCSWQNVRTP